MVAALSLFVGRVISLRLFRILCIVITKRFFFMAGLKVRKSCLNREAPEFFPNRNQNAIVEVPYLNRHLPITPPLLSSLYPSFDDHGPPFPSLQTYTIPFCTRSLYTNPYQARPVIQTHETQPVSLKDEATRKPEVVVPNRHRTRGRSKNKIRDKQKCRHKNSTVEDRCCEYTEDFSSKYPRNVQYRAAPPKQRHPVVPVEKDGRNTTVMIRNIPNKYTRQMLMNFLDDHCMAENQKAKNENFGAVEEELIVSAYDFLYLPIDFKYRMNKGYAFVNFTNARAVWKFYLASHNLPWGAFQSNKIREIAYARLQGKDELVKHFQSVYFPCNGKEEYLPVCFSPARDGSIQNVNERTVGRCTGARDKIRLNQTKSSAV